MLKTLFKLLKLQYNLIISMQKLLCLTLVLNVLAQMGQEDPTYPVYVTPTVITSSISSNSSASTNLLAFNLIKLEQAQTCVT